MSLRDAARLAFACVAAFVSGSIAAQAAPSDALPAHVSQGALVIARVPPGSDVTLAGHKLRVADDGRIVFGIGRDEKGPVHVNVRSPRSAPKVVAIAIDPRDWPVERIEGVPPKTVEPPPEVAERIRREQARVVAARDRDDARTDFAARFAWPVTGRISGRFGNQRVYVVDGKDVPKAPHSGMDIAVPEGTPVKAPAGGVVTFVDTDLYLTGGTLLIDHGHGVSSNFLHLSRIDVKVGDRVEQGQRIAAVGHTGRATGPHLHWGMNWFDVRLDPLLALDPGDSLSKTAAIVDLVGPTAVGYTVTTMRGGDANADASIGAALDDLAECAKIDRFALRTERVRAELLTLREPGQDDVQLVLPPHAGAYLFWPGRKSGLDVAAGNDGATFPTTLKRAAASYFDIAACGGA